MEFESVDSQEGNQCCDRCGHYYSEEKSKCPYCSDLTDKQVEKFVAEIKRLKPIINFQLGVILFCGALVFLVIFLLGLENM